MIVRKTLRNCWLILLLALSASVPAAAQVPILPTSPPSAIVIPGDRYIRSPRLGITQISALDVPADDKRYRNALLLGAGWNRWPLYWDRVEYQPGQFNWGGYDALLAEDVRHHLRVNTILLGRPDFYRDNARISGLHNPIFADGTDTPAAGKALNPDNPWVNFVFQAVQRYKPGGGLAQINRWVNGEGISEWEVWNEPDYKPFWEGTIGDYARLLKTAYIVIKLADPNAKVIFGGLLFPGEDNWLARVLAIYQNDPMREQNNWYMDIVAIHNYSYPWRSGWLVLWAKQTLKAYGLQRPVWLNESGTPVWDDYPGPTWAQAQDRQLRATSRQQADFFIQSTAYAWAEGAEVVFYHQLYDDCGNQPGGTNFPPHNGELCVDGALCAGDAFGLFRNERDSVCFSQHPLPGSARPAAAAFYLLAQHLGAGELAQPKVDTLQGAVTMISFDRPQSGDRVYVIWNKSFENVVLDFPASAPSATLYGIDQTYMLVPTTDGIYQIGLPAATPDYFPFLSHGDRSAVGGPTFILVERPAGGLNTPTPPLALPTLEAMPVTPGAVPLVPVRPTVDPAQDTTPPVAAVAPLPELSQATFTVTWNGTDDSGIAQYLIWVRVDGGEWLPWLQTTRTEGQYTGERGRTYEFAAWALDFGGNWSANTDIRPQAVTRVE